MADCNRDGNHYQRHRYKAGEMNCAGCGAPRSVAIRASERLARLEARGEIGQAIEIGGDIPERDLDTLTL
jgi:ribosomal protein L37E